MAVFFDTHAHLDYPDYAPDLAEVIARAQAAGITRIISIGTNVASSERAIALAEKFTDVFAVVGWHPTDALDAPEDLRPALRGLARHPKVVAIGETDWTITICRARNRNVLKPTTRATNKSRQIFSGNKWKSPLNWD